MRITVEISPGTVFQFGHRWKFSLFVQGERFESTQSFDKVGAAKQAMRNTIDNIKARK